MKKIINKPSDFVEESIDGLVKSHPDVYAFAPDNKRVIKTASDVQARKKIYSGSINSWKHYREELFNSYQKLSN